MHACLSEEGKKKKRLSTGQQYFLLHTETHTHMHVHTHTLNSFKQMTVITDNELRCTAPLRSAALTSVVTNTVEKQNVN